MSNIEISNLYPVGSNLFQDCESFLNELTDSEVIVLIGGIRTPRPTPPVFLPPCTYPQPTPPVFLPPHTYAPYSH
jgi:hypothetical protein